MLEALTLSRLARLLVIALLVYAMVATVALLFAERLIFQPPRASYRADAFPFASIAVGNGSIPVAHLSNDSARYTILFSHGNAEDLGDVMPLLRRLQALGFAVIGFISTYRVVTRIPLLPFDRFPNLARVRALDRPLLVIHGTRDFIVPFSHGKRLFAAARDPKLALWVEGAGHNDVIAVAGEAYDETIHRFTQTLRGPARK